MFDDPIAFNVQRAAELSGVSRSTLYKFIRAGRLKIRKCGTRTLIRIEDLKQLIDNLPTDLEPGGDDAS